MTCISSTVLFNFFLQSMFCLSVKTIKKSFCCLYSSGSRLQSLTEEKAKTVTMTGKSVYLLEAENRTLKQLGGLDSKVVFHSVCKCKQKMKM